MAGQRLKFLIMINVTIKKISQLIILLFVIKYCSKYVVGMSQNCQTIDRIHYKNNTLRSFAQILSLKRTPKNKNYNQNVSLVRQKSYVAYLLNQLWRQRSLFRLLELSDAHFLSSM